MSNILDELSIISFVRHHFSVNVPAHDNSILIASAQKPPINSHTDLLSGTRDLSFSLGLQLHPHFVYPSSEGSDESAHLRRLVKAFDIRQYDKYQNSMCWRINM